MTRGFYYLGFFFSFFLTHNKCSAWQSLQLPTSGGNSAKHHQQRSRCAQVLHHLEGLKSSVLAQLWRNLTTAVVNLETEFWRSQVFCAVLLLAACFIPQLLLDAHRASEDLFMLKIINATLQGLFHTRCVSIFQLLIWHRYFHTD